MLRRRRFRHPHGVRNLLRARAGAVLEVLQQTHMEDVKFIFPQFAAKPKLSPGETLCGRTLLFLPLACCLLLACYCWRPWRRPLCASPDQCAHPVRVRAAEARVTTPPHCAPRQAPDRQRQLRHLRGPARVRARRRRRALASRRARARREGRGRRRLNKRRAQRRKCIRASPAAPPGTRGSWRGAVAGGATRAALSCSNRSSCSRARLGSSSTSGGRKWLKGSSAQRAGRPAPAARSAVRWTARARLACRRRGCRLLCAETCPVSTEGGTRRVQLVREGRGGGGGGTRRSAVQGHKDARAGHRDARAHARGAEGVLQEQEPLPHL